MKIFTCGLIIRMPKNLKDIKRNPKSLIISNIQQRECNKLVLRENVNKITVDEILLRVDSKKYS